MGRFLLLLRILREHLRIALLGLLVAAAPVLAQTSHELTASAEQVVHDIEDAVAAAQPLVERYGYAGVAGAISVEGFGLPAPGQTFLMAAALESATGHLNIGLVATLAALAAVMGNSLGYLIGKLGGPPLLRKLRVSEAREAKIAALFARYGGGIIVLARFFDGPRQLNGIVAGTFEMRWWVFTAFNIIGAVLWVGVWGLGTYYLSEHLHAVDTFIRKLNPWVIGIVAIGALAAIVYLIRGRRDQPLPVEQDRDANTDSP
ncbi:MAG: DedA family protein [Chromatiaceae bacterium]|nr:DedA family protein [Chromatiaceae bacterium]